MLTVEQQIAETLAQFLTARGDRIACDYGLLELRSVGATVIASLNGDTYEVVITVSRMVP
jgi:hypothetical protein